MLKFALPLGFVASDLEHGKAKQGDQIRSQQSQRAFKNDFAVATEHRVLRNVEHDDKYYSYD